MKKPILDDEIRNLIPVLSSEEYRQLQTNMLADGCPVSLKMPQKPRKTRYTLTKPR